MLIVWTLFHSVSSGSDSDSDDSEKNSTESELSNWNKSGGNDDGADSGNSTVAEDEDDFNPFRMSGSDDEGDRLQFDFKHIAHRMCDQGGNRCKCGIVNFVTHSSCSTFFSNWNIKNNHIT